VLIPPLKIPQHEILVKGRRKRILSKIRNQAQRWQGLIVLKGKAICGASLFQVQPEDRFAFWAVTAAHCVENS